jgi:hypothetical protein
LLCGGIAGEHVRAKKVVAKIEKAIEAKTKELAEKVANITSHHDVNHCQNVLYVYVIVK